MNQKEVQDMLTEVGAIITGTHVTYTSYRHGDSYINKDAVYPHTKKTSRLCRAIAERFVDDNVEVVIAPAIGGTILSQWTAHHLSEMSGREVLALYAEKGNIKDYPDRPVDEKDQNGEIFVIKRGYEKIIPGKRVLVVEDVLNTGGSALKVVQAVRFDGGEVIGVGALCNRGGVTAQDLADVPKLVSLMDITLQSWPPLDCPLCKQGVPMRTDIGKGREPARGPAMI